MVVMLLGGNGTDLGCQWLAAISGLIVGTQVALTSLIGGQHAGILIMRHLDKTMASTVVPEEVELRDSKDQVSRTTHVEHRKPLQNPSESSPWSWFSAATTFISLSITAASLYGAISLAGAPFLRKVCIAVLLGPVGAILRWRLGGFNGLLTGSFSWLPIGTLAANMVACALAFVAHGLSIQLHPLSTSEALVIFAIKSGFCGALSTVSTWVVEVGSSLLFSFLHPHGPSLPDTSCPTTGPTNDGEH